MENGILNRIQNFKNSTFPVLTLYIGSADKSSPHPSYCLSQLHSLVTGNLSDEQRRFWQKDIDRIEKYFQEQYKRSNTRTIVFFTSGKKIWEVLEFEFYLPPLLVILHSPYTKPVEEALQTYQKYLVLLTDREKARLFTVHLGKIEEQLDFFNGEVPQKVKAKKTDYGRDDKILRHIDDHLRRLLQFVSQKTFDFAKGKHVQFIIIGGNKLMIPKIKRFLKHPLKKMVLGEFITDLNVPINEIFINSKKIASRINAKLS